MTVQRDTETLCPLPGIAVPGRYEKVEICRIPAFADIAGINSKAETVDGGTLSLPRALYLTENPDRTYAILNNLELIEPELSRSSNKYVWAAIVQFGAEHQYEESLLRDFLAFVEPARNYLSIGQCLKEIFSGSVANLATIYGTEKSDPHHWSTWRSAFPDGKLTPATFYRVKDKVLGRSDANEDEPDTERLPIAGPPCHKQEVLESTRESATPPSSNSKKEKPSQTKAKTDDTDQNARDDAQGDLFD